MVGTTELSVDASYRGRGTGALLVFQLPFRTGLASAAVAGTCFEYGMADGELSEELLVAPANPYGLAKHLLHRQQALGASALSPAGLFEMFGTDQVPSSPHPMIKRAYAWRPAEFPMLVGEHLRDLLSVENVAPFLVALPVDPAASGIVNVCLGRLRLVRGLVEVSASGEDWQPRLLLGRYLYPG